MQGSTVVEISQDGRLMRPNSGYQQWVLPVEQRDPSAHAPVFVAPGQQISEAQLPAQPPPPPPPVPSAAKAAAVVAPPAPPPQPAVPQPPAEPDMFQLDEVCASIHPKSCTHLWQWNPKGLGPIYTPCQCDAML